MSGTDLDQTNTEKVRVGETLKSYPVGRYVDSTDTNVMHEAHVVYRTEAGASWNLNPNAPTVVPLGPVLAVADQAKTPGPLPAELEQKMAEQNGLLVTGGSDCHGMSKGKPLIGGIKVPYECVERLRERVMKRAVENGVMLADGTPTDGQSVNRKS